MCVFLVANDTGLVSVSIAVFIAVTMLLFYASVLDVTSRRVPNELVLAVAVIVLAGYGVHWGAVDISLGLLSFALASAVFFPMYLVGGVAAGDVKLVAAVALMFSPLAAINFIILTFICGGMLVGFYATLRWTGLWQQSTALAGIDKKRSDSGLVEEPNRPLHDRFKNASAIPYVPAIALSFVTISLLARFGAAIC